MTSSIISQAMSRTNQFADSMARERKRLRAEREAVLSDPDKFDKIVAGVAERYSLSPKKVKKKDGLSKVIGIERANTGTPMEGFGIDLAERFSANLSKARGRKSVGDVLNKSTVEALAPRLEESYKYKMQKDSSLFNFGGIFGGSKDVREIPGYTQYKEQVAARPGKDRSIGMLGSAAFMGGATGAAIGAKAGLMKLGVTGATGFNLLSKLPWMGRLAGRTLSATPNPWTKIVGAALLAMPWEAVFNQVDKQIAKTEFAKSREDSILNQRMLVDLAVFGGIGKAGHKIFTKSLEQATIKGVLSDAAKEVFMKSPTARNAIAAGYAQQAEKLAGKDLNKSIYNFSKILGSEKTKHDVAANLLKEHRSTMEKYGIFHTQRQSAAGAAVPRVIRGSIVNEPGKPLWSGERAMTAMERKAMLDRQTASALNTGGAVPVKTTAAMPGEVVVPGKAEQVTSKTFLNIEAINEESTGIARPPVSKALRSGKKAQTALERKAEIDAKVAKLAGLQEEKIVPGQVAPDVGKLAQRLAKETNPQEFEWFLEKSEAMGAELAATETLENVSILKMHEAKVKAWPELAVDPAKITELEVLLKEEQKRAQDVLKVIQGKRGAKSALSRIRKRAEERAKNNVDDAVVEGVVEKEVAVKEVVVEEPVVEKVKKRGRKTAAAETEKYTKKDIPTVTELEEEITAIEASRADRLAEVDEHISNRVDYLKKTYREGSPRLEKEKQHLAEWEKNRKAAIDIEIADEIKGAARRAERIARNFEIQEKRKLSKAAEATKQGTRKEMSDQETISMLIKEGLPGLEELDNEIASVSRDVFDNAERVSINSLEGYHAGWDGGKFMWAAIIPASVLLASAMPPSTAEASTLSTAAKVGIPKIIAAGAKKFGNSLDDMLKYFGEADSAGYTIRAVTDEFVAPRAAQAIDWAAKIVKKYGSLEKGVKGTKWKSPIPASIHSPHLLEEAIYRTDAQVTPQLGHMQSVIFGNARNNLTVGSNILKAVGAYDPKVTKEIIKEMEPLAAGYERVNAYAVAEMRLRNTEKAIENLTKKYNKNKKLRSLRTGIEHMEDQKLRFEGIMEELQPHVDSFKGAWESKVKELAGKYKQVRLSLAAEDSKFAKYPWLEGMMNYDEKIAVARTRDLFDHYTERMINQNLDVIGEDFVHHAWHPMWNRDKPLEILAEMGMSTNRTTPYTKFFRRSKHSVQMVPDLAYNLQKYIPDAEKRLAWNRFWDMKNPNGWYRHSNSFLVQENPLLRNFWQSIKDASKPMPAGKLDHVARLYTSLEVMTKLAFSPSVALKHGFKMAGTWSTFGFKHSAKNFKEALGISWRRWRNSAEVRNMGKNFGLNGYDLKKGYDEFVDSYIYQGNMLNTVMDLQNELAYNNSSMVKGKFMSWLDVVNEKGSSLVRAVEYFDRVHTFISSMEMAAIQGKTIKEATYGTYKNIIKTNFIGGALNPAWMKNPLVRAIALFQNTPFKIWERRLINAAYAGKDVKTAWGVIRNQDIGTSLKELFEIRQYIKQGQSELKQNMVLDALLQSKDFYGTPYVQQVMRELLYTGMLLSGGSFMGYNLMSQVGHIPFMKHGSSEPTLSVSPLARAIYKTTGEVVDEGLYVGEDDEFFASRFMRSLLSTRKEESYLRGVIPYTFRRVMRISDRDIPEMYNDSWGQYMFAVPSKGEH